MLTKKEIEEKDDKLKNSKGYWLFIAGIAFVFLLLARWAMVYMNSRIMEARRAFWPLFFKGLIVLFVLACIFGVIIMILNYAGKKEERDKHQQ